MQPAGKSSEAEMVAEWLKAELWSKRFGKPIKKTLCRFKQGQKLITTPDLKNKQENLLRKKILFTYRKEMLNDFPKKITWEKASLNLADLKKIKYINYDYWVNLSTDSRLAKEAVKNIQKGVRIFNQSNQPFLQATRYLTNRGYFPKMILIATHPNAPVVVLEGHLRLTAYLMEPTFIPKKLEVIIGYSPEFANWDLY